MGVYFLAHHLFAEAETEFKAAAAGDSACQAKAAAMLDASKILREMASAKKEETSGGLSDEDEEEDDELEGLACGL